MLTRRILCRSLALSGLAALAGAGRARAAVPAAAPTSVSNVLSMQAAWVNDAEFMGYYLAVDKGYYSAAGIDLKYVSGGPSVIPESTLLAGKADIALTSPDTTISAIVNQGAPFVIIGAQYQKDPLGVVSLTKSGIKGPKDLVGKTV